MAGLSAGCKALSNGLNAPSKSFFALCSAAILGAPQQLRSPEKQDVDSGRRRTARSPHQQHWFYRAIRSSRLSTLQASIFFRIAALEAKMDALFEIAREASGLKRDASLCGFERLLMLPSPSLRVKRSHPALPLRRGLTPENDDLGAAGWLRFARNDAAPPRGGQVLTLKRLKSLVSKVTRVTFEIAETNGQRRPRSGDSGYMATAIPAKANGLYPPADQRQFFTSGISSPCSRT
jgi:hypothetical protein